MAIKPTELKKALARGRHAKKSLVRPKRKSMPQSKRWGKITITYKENTQSGHNGNQAD